MNYRNLRLANLIQEELGKMILREVEFPKSTLVTIVGVEVINDLRQAKIKLGIIPATAAKEALDILERNKSFLQYSLMKKINIKQVPRIEFELNADKLEISD
ncbi:MAG: 30S ribosome-binding factor RbfA [Patescibacteria group bacterium]